MFPHIEKITGFLDDVYSWRPANGGGFVGTFLGLATKAFSDQDITDYHPQLANAWHAYFTHLKEQNISNLYLSREHAISMLLLQRHTPIAFESIYGEQIHMLEVLNIVNEDDHPIVNIQGTKIVIDEAELNGSHLRYVTAIFHNGVDVFKANMDSTYPGWEIRWTMGCELDIPKYELAEQAFKRSLEPLHATGLSDLSPCY